MRKAGMPAAIRSVSSLKIRIRLPGMASVMAQTARE